jgi:hypothetical protein
LSQSLAETIGKLVEQYIDAMDKVLHWFEIYQLLIVLVNISEYELL